MIMPISSFKLPIVHSKPEDHSENLSVGSKKTNNYAIEFTSAPSQMRGDDIDTLHTLSLADMQAMMVFAIQYLAVEMETPTSALPFLEMLTDAYTYLKIL